MEVPPDPSRLEISFDCIKAAQPIGDLYIAVIPHRDLIKFTYFDVRRVISAERDVEKYLGIQRPLSKARLKDLEAYVNFIDATFPTSVIVAINDSRYAQFDEGSKKFVVRNYQANEEKPSIAIRQLGRVIDGQHRIAGLEAFAGERFDVSVTLFVEADIADQAHIFSTVNLEQTKVNKNLVYDLYELAKTRSPQKTCHVIAVNLDRDKDSPFFGRVKRLGFSTEGAEFEPISQATFVEGLMEHITREPKLDRDRLLRGEPLTKASGDEVFQLVLRNLFIEGKDIEIMALIYNYFSAVRQKWPEAWAERGRGFMLNRTNGVKALLRFFRFGYTQVAHPGDAVTQQKFFERVFQPLRLADRDFTTDNFPPGTSGEAKLLRVLRGKETL